MKSKKIKQKAVLGLVTGKLKLCRVRPKMSSFFWHKGTTMYGIPRLTTMSELELKLVYNKDNFIELPAVWDGSNSTRDVVYVPTHDGDITVNLTTCDVLGFRPMTNEEMLNSLKAGHRPAVMSQGHLMQEVLNHGSEVMSTMMTPMHGKLYPDGDWDGDNISFVNTNIKFDCISVTDSEMNKCINVNTPEELSAMWIEDNTFLLNTLTKYYINIGEGYILIYNKKYRFELEDLNLSLDMDGDWISTHMLHNNLVCNANSRIGINSYKEIKILGEIK